MISSVALSGNDTWMDPQSHFSRSRPINHLVTGAGGYSFPSGHSLGRIYILRNNYFLYCGIQDWIFFKVDVNGICDNS